MAAAPLKIAHLVMAAYGGPGMAAYRLHKTLLEIGVDSHFLARESLVGWEGVEVLEPERARGALRGHLVQHTAKALWWLSGREREAVDFQAIPRGYLPAIDRAGYDLVHFHWVNGRVASLAEIRDFRTPVVWSLHDISAFAGPSPYLGPNLDRWLAAAGRMRTVDADPHPLARLNHAAKQRIYRGKQVAAIAPSRWMEQAARESGVFPEGWVRHIPYEMPEGPWQRQERAAARRLLELPEDAAIVLFGADSLSSPRKGGDLLMAAMRDLAGGPRPVTLASFGHGADTLAELPGITLRNFGHVRDPGRLAALFAAADVFVAPSREDNLPNVVLESLAAGTPVAAFRIGGMPDMIVDGVTGRLAEPFSTGDLAAAMQDLLGWSAERAAETSRACRAHVATEFSSARQGGSMLAFYHEFLARK
ncbi:glycosyltransferase [Luteolibacter sp. LG18]|uniref:glycosyltransferase n=1 Tax=Luteolibacter sp. LG18 TaxID=2819286 RepID=UPI002B2CFDA0|nr:glycosyl transferase [Luteolibacter sp. LG18]